MRGKYLKLVFFFVLWGGMADLYADEMGGVIYGLRKGYSDSTVGERHRERKEMVLINEPETDEIPLMDVIFTSKFTREIREKYEREFGRTEVERNWFAPSRFVELEYSNGVRVTPEEDVRRKRAFGEYMIKKLCEYHVDEYFKSNPSVRPIYEVKERISHMDVGIKGGYELKVRYFYAGNYVKVRMNNPYEVRNGFILQMDPNSVGPSKVTGVILHLGYDLTRKVGVDSYYDSREDSVKIVGYRRVSHSLITSISGTSGVPTNFRTSEPFGIPGISKENRFEGEFENKILFGVSWNP